MNTKVIRRLFDDEGRELWSQSASEDPGEVDNEMIVLTLPARLLPQGDYSVKLRGLRVAGELDDLASTTFGDQEIASQSRIPIRPIVHREFLRHPVQSKPVVEDFKIERRPAAVSPYPASLTPSSPRLGRLLGDYVRYNENFVLVSPRPESPKRERGSVEISLAGASGSHPTRLGDIKGASPWLVSFCRETRHLRLPSLDKEGKPWPRPRRGRIETVAEKPNRVEGSQRVAPPQWRCAPHPLLSRGGEFPAIFQFRDRN